MEKTMKNDILQKLENYGQEHLLQYYGELTAEEREQLISDIRNADFSVLENIGGSALKKRGTISPVNAVSVEDIQKKCAEYERAGLEIIRSGKVAAVLLAGGQGTRLGFDGPKGCYNIGINKKLSIFGQQMNNIAEVTKQAGAYFHIFIMTSAANRGQTVEFFKENNYFGYPENKLHFYVQEQAPVSDYSGKVYLSEKHRVALAPNGNGGWYLSLIKSGLSKVIEKENIEWLNVYSVDNVLQRICDPAFIGATVAANCNCGAKVVKKAYPEEKVGVLCLEDGKPAIIEYYEMPDALKYERDGSGGLKYCYGVILNYLFNVKALNETSCSLPYHLADKALAHIKDGVKVVPDKPCGYKFETLVVDMVKLMGTCLAYEVVREKEFAPVKNAEGADSVQTARELLIKNGIEI